MIRFVGGIIICLSMSALGLKKAVAVEQRLDILNEFEKSLVLLKGEIKYSTASLPEAVFGVSNRTSGCIKEFYERIHEQLLNNSELSFKAIWDENINTIFKDEIIDVEDKTVIRELGAQLGHLDIEMQVKSIELSMNRLKERQMAATEDIRSKSKLYKTIGVAGGALITLVLI